MADAASAEFILAGHSNKWALGGYAGPPALVRRAWFGRVGHFVAEETPLPRSDVYWQMYIDGARGRDALLSYQGSQHIVSFLFAQAPGFDFLEPLVAGPLEPGATIVPRRMVMAQLGPSMRGWMQMDKSLFASFSSEKEDSFFQTASIHIVLPTIMPRELISRRIVSMRTLVIRYDTQMMPEQPLLPIRPTVGTARISVQPSLLA